MGAEILFFEMDRRLDSSGDDDDPNPYLELFLVMLRPRDMLATESFSTQGTTGVIRQKCRGRDI